MNSTPDIGDAQRALSRGSWQEAFDRFTAILMVEEMPEALEGLGQASCWLNDSRMMFEARDRAYALYREQGRAIDAARVAVANAYQYGIAGDLAVAGGWIARAERLLIGLPECEEHGWLAIGKAYVGIDEGHLEVAARSAAEAAMIGKHLSRIDIEMHAEALRGLVLLSRGQIEEGLQIMDEAAAAALAGEIRNLDSAGAACCSLMYACDALGDYDRAGQWCQRAREFCRRWGLVSLFAQCRTYYAPLLIWRGEWQEAESELLAAIGELPQTSMPGMSALSRLAELRRRQGRRAEAEALLAQSEAHPMSLFVRAELALDYGDHEASIDLLDRFRRRIEPTDLAEGVFALEMMIEALIPLKRLDEAQTVLTELHALAATRTAPLRASACRAAGRLAWANGRMDDARRFLEDAIDELQRAGAPFEVARSRVLLSRVLFSLGRTTHSLAETQRAETTFETLGALPFAKLARVLKEEIERSQEGSPKSSDLFGLTEREVEVLRLICAGKSNQQIAEMLVLSVRTVERHVSNLYDKLGVRGKVARASATAFAINQGLI